MNLQVDEFFIEFSYKRFMQKFSMNDHIAIRHFTQTINENQYSKDHNIYKETFKYQNIDPYLHMTDCSADLAFVISKVFSPFLYQRKKEISKFSQNEQ